MSVSGGNRGDAAVSGRGRRNFRLGKLSAAPHGALAWAWRGGAAGAFGGAIIGAMVGVAIYKNYM